MNIYLHDLRFGKGNSVWMFEIEFCFWISSQTETGPLRMDWIVFIKGDLRIRV